MGGGAGTLEDLGRVTTMFTMGGGGGGGGGGQTLEDLGRVTTMFTKPPPLPSIRFYKIPTTPPSLVDS